MTKILQFNCPWISAVPLRLVKVDEYRLCNINMHTGFRVWIVDRDQHYRLNIQFMLKQLGPDNWLLTWLSNEGTIEFEHFEDKYQVDVCT